MIRKWFRECREKSKRIQTKREESRAIAWFLLYELKPQLQRYPSRCQYIYDLIRVWAKGDMNKITAAAKFIFLWELEQKKADEGWEIPFIVDEIQAKKVET
jgi:hypothetical protein